MRVASPLARPYVLELVLVLLLAGHARLPGVLGLRRGSVPARARPNAEDRPISRSACAGLRAFHPGQATCEDTRPRAAILGAPAAVARGASHRAAPEIGHLARSRGARRYDNAVLSITKRRSLNPVFPIHSVHAAGARVPACPPPRAQGGAARGDPARGARARRRALGAGCLAGRHRSPRGPREVERPPLLRDPRGGLPAAPGTGVGELAGRCRGAALVGGPDP